MEILEGLNLSEALCITRLENLCLTAFLPNFKSPMHVGTSEEIQLSYVVNIIEDILAKH